MKVISYSEEHIVTTDEIADEVLSYARELGRQNSADTIDIPAVYEDGHIGEVHILIGPASQITVFDSPALAAEIPDGRFLDEIRRRYARLRPSRAVIAQEDLGDGYDPDAPLSFDDA
jgi:hypothetical protein